MAILQFYMVVIFTKNLLIVGGGRKQTVEAYLQHSYLFLLMQYFHLTTNMHLQSQLDFQRFLSDISESIIGLEVEILLRMVAHRNSLDGLINTIFNDPVDFSENVILIVQNNDA